MADKRPPSQMVNSALGAKSVRLKRTFSILKMKPAGCLGSLISLREQSLRVRPATLCAAFDWQATVVAKRRVAVLAPDYGTEHWPVTAEEAAKTHQRIDSFRSDGEEGGQRSECTAVTKERHGTCGGLEWRRENKIKAVALGNR